MSANALRKRDTRECARSNAGSRARCWCERVRRWSRCQSSCSPFPMQNVCSIVIQRYAKCMRSLYRWCFKRIRLFTHSSARHQRLIYIYGPYSWCSLCWLVSCGTKSRFTFERRDCVCALHCWVLALHTNALTPPNQSQITSAHTATSIGL